MRIMKSISLSLLIMTLALVGISRMAFSSDRVDFTPELLEVVRKIPNGQDKIRLYVSRTLTSYQKLYLGNDQDIVTGEIELSSGKKVFKDKLKNNRPGKIISIESLSGGIEKIFITFDPACKIKDCAFSFSRFMNNPKFADRYYLDQVAKIPGFKVVRVVSGNWGDRTELNPGTGLSSIDFLEVKLDEMNSVSRSSHNHPGIDPEN